MNAPPDRSVSPPPGVQTTVFVRPGVLSILIRSFRALVVAIVAWALWWWGKSAAAAALEPLALPPWPLDVLLGIVLVWASARLLYEILLRQSRLYSLSPDRVSSRSGVLRRVTAEAPLRNIQQIVVDRTLPERMCRLGTILVTTAGSQSVDVAWVMVPRAGAMVGAIRDAMERARPVPTWLIEDPSAPPRPVVIGLVGGIGAGKSAVAGILANLGCLVIDSDKDAKAALDRPEVRDRLVRWWGSRVLDASGRVDRKVVAQIVFSDPTQRTRLEEVVHPLVKARRADLIERAAAECRPGVVIDAPLLFEAASDRECDIVMFVDAPLQLRQARVSSRGWDVAELNRREQAQLPLDEKRRRSHVIVMNDSDLQVLEQRVTAAFDRARRKIAGSGSPSPAPGAKKET